MDIMSAPTTKSYSNNRTHLDDITIVIPTSNRNYYFSRCVSYLSKINVRNIVVADSSSSEKKKINKEIISKINSDINIRYLEYNQESEKYGGDIYRKWADAINHVHTKYALICTDKEFVVPSTLAFCIESLEKNPDCNVAEGKYYYIEISNGRYRLREMYPSKTPLMEDDVVSRLKKCRDGKNVSSNQLALRRTDFYKSLYDTLAKYDIDDIRFGEFTLEFLTIIRSKCIYINQPYKYRDILNLNEFGISHSSESSSLRYPYLDGYIRDGIYSHYYSQFIECMVNEIVNNSNYDVNFVRDFSSEIFPQIIKKRKFFGNRRFSQDPLWYIWRHSPNLIKNSAANFVPDKYLNYASEELPCARKVFNLIEQTKKYYNSDKPIV